MTGFGCAEQRKHASLLLVCAHINEKQDLAGQYSAAVYFGLALAGLVAESIALSVCVVAGGKVDNAYPTGP